MMSKLTHYCNSLMEASWLAIVLIVPVLFNTGSERIFEPEKLALLRSLVFIMVGVWLVKISEQVLSPKTIPRWQPASYIKNPIVIIIFILAISYGISTLFSVAPDNSFWGSYYRQQGLLTQISLICFFAVLLANLRHREQFDRLVTTAILSSVFVCLYGILQHFHLDPMFWSSDASLRVMTTLGNPVYSAAYIAMIFPLTVLHVIQLSRKVFQKGDKKYAFLLELIGYSFIAVIQVALIIFSQSHGPFLGLIASTGFLLLGIAFYFQKRTLIYVCLGITVIISAIIIGISVVFPGANILSSSSPYRILNILDSSNNNGLLRTLYWQDTARLVLPHDPLQYSDGKRDNLNALRPVIGYGLDSLAYIYPRVYSTAITKAEGQYTPPDRAHNQVWDMLAAGGLAGLIIYQTLIAFLFYDYLKWQRVFPDRRGVMIYWLFYLGSGLCLSIVLCAWRGFDLVGVSLPLGFTAGFLLYLLFIFLYRTNEINDQS